jgi:hemerythrin-like domain-containing protein
MRIIDTLVAEHRTIELVLIGLESYAMAARDGADVNKDDLPRFVRFITEYADACHHGKEEEILFVKMVEHGFPQEDGPIAVMLHEHGVGRQYVENLKQVAELDDWDDNARTQMSEAALNFIYLLRGHIQKEDNILYPMAQQHMPPEALASADQAGDQFEEKLAESGKKVELEALGRELAERYAG